MKRVTRAQTTGVTRASSHFTEVQESHKASGGIYEERREREGGEGVEAKRQDEDAADAYPSLLNTANLEKGADTHRLIKTHTEA